MTLESLHERLVDYRWRYREWRRQRAIRWHPKRTLVVRWTNCPIDGNNMALERLTGKRGDLLYMWGDGAGRNAGALLHNWLAYGKFDPSTRQYGPPLLEELAERGYDISTLEISIRKKKR